MDDFKLLLFAAFLSLFGAASAFDGVVSNKTSKFLFSTVLFKHDPCNANQNNEAGLCMSSDDCNSYGGAVLGNCASGFGVCCQFTVTECGSSVSHNCSIVQSPVYPSAYTSAGSCTHTIDKIQASQEICSVRIDFIDHRMNPPEAGGPLGEDPTAGECVNDQTTFKTGSGRPAPVICGTNTGLHMYLDYGPPDGSGSTISVTHTTTGTTFERFFRYKVSYIPCYTTYTPPQGCLQYHTGVAGAIKSFNFDGDVSKSNNQYYNICMRQEKGFCQIQYSPTNEPIAFKVGKGPNNRKSHAGTTDCRNDAVIIPRSKNRNVVPKECYFVVDYNNGEPIPDPPSARWTFDRFCGGNLGCVEFDNFNLQNQVVSLSGAPFIVGVHFDDKQSGRRMGVLQPRTENVKGFHLNYLQLPC